MGGQAEVMHLNWVLKSGRQIPMHTISSRGVSSWKAHGLTHSGSHQLFDSMLREYKRSCLQRSGCQPLEGTFYGEDKRSLWRELGKSDDSRMEGWIGCGHWDPHTALSSVNVSLSLLESPSSFDCQGKPLIFWLKCPSLWAVFPSSPTSSLIIKRTTNIPPSIFCSIVLSISMNLPILDTS